MTGALIILAVLVVTGVVLYLHHRLHPEADEPKAPATVGDEPAEGECCGMHAVCEKDSLMIIDDEIIYYDDEELDRFKGRDAADYTAEEENELRDVMLTLRPDEVAPWYRSLTLRGIELPAGLRDEMLMLVADKRNSQ